MNELQILSMLFVGMSVGSLSPLGIYGTLGFLTFAVILFIIGEMILIKDRKDKIAKEMQEQ